MAVSYVVQNIVATARSDSLVLRDWFARGVVSLETSDGMRLAIEEGGTRIRIIGARTEEQVGSMAAEWDASEVTLVHMVATANMGRPIDLDPIAAANNLRVSPCGKLVSVMFESRRALRGRAMLFASGKLALMGCTTREQLDALFAEVLALLA